MLSRATKLVRLGRSSADLHNAVNPPVVRGSTTLFPTLAAFRASYSGVTFEVARYGRSGTSTVFELQAALADLCDAETCIATASGLSALAAVLGAHAGAGKQILIQSDVYGPTRILAETELVRQGCDVRFFETEQQLESLICSATSLVLIEIPASLTMRMIDVRSVCHVAHAHGIPVCCDSSWGTPLFFDAHGLGIDISVHAATKYIGGHSDIMLGLITGSYAALASTRDWCAHYGSTAAPDNCWLALRGLRTLEVRLQRHQATATQVATWMRDHQKIERVLFPALEEDAGYDLWKAQFSGAAGPFIVELSPCSEVDYERFIESLRLFGLGTSWGGFESLIMPAIPHNLRESKEFPAQGRLVRLHVGLEDPTDLCADLEQALEWLSV